jgi:hypothetical protein
MLGNMTLRMQEKYRGVDNVGKKKDVDVRHTEKRNTEIKTG